MRPSWVRSSRVSAGTPNKSTLRNELRQHTTDDFRQYLQLPDLNLVKETLEVEKNRLRLALAGEINVKYTPLKIHFMALR